MSGSSIFASVWLKEGDVWEVDEGRPRYVVKVAGSEDLIDGRQATTGGDMLSVGTLSRGAFDFSQCIFPFVLAGGGYTLYRVASSADGGPNDILGAGNSAVSRGTADIWWLLPLRM
jgi:hypothetical protein